MTFIRNGGSLAGKDEEGLNVIAHVKEAKYKKSLLLLREID